MKPYSPAMSCCRSEAEHVLHQAVSALDALTRADPESAHSEADDILLALVPPAVYAAYQRAASRCTFWYA